MVSPQDVAPPPVEQAKAESSEEQKTTEPPKAQEQQTTEQDTDHQMLSPTTQHQMELAMDAQLQQQMEPQQLLLQCQLCAGLSVLSSDQIQPGAEIGCGFCGSPSVIIQDTTVPPSMPIDYSYDLPIDLFSSLSLSDGINNIGMMDMNSMPTMQMPMFDPTLHFGNNMMADHMFEPEVQLPPAEPTQQQQQPEERTETAEAGEGRGRRRPLPSPGLENEMKRRSWVVSNLREQHEEFMRMLDGEEEKEDARKAAEEKLNAASSGGGGGGSAGGAEGNKEVDEMQAHMIGTMMALRQQMAGTPDERYRYADAEEDGMMVEAKEGSNSSSDEEQIFATPEQAEQMRKRREELRKDEKEKERARRWRMSGMGSLGVDRRSVGAVS